MYECKRWTRSKNHQYGTKSTCCYFYRDILEVTSWTVMINLIYIYVYLYTLLFFFSPNSLSHFSIYIYIFFFYPLSTILVSSRSFWNVYVPSTSSVKGVNDRRRSEDVLYYDIKLKTSYYGVGKTPSRKSRSRFFFQTPRNIERFSNY